jgi:hypothetical protein
VAEKKNFISAVVAVIIFISCVSHVLIKSVFTVLALGHDSTKHFISFFCSKSIQIPQTKFFINFLLSVNVLKGQHK